jgi:hypothetical protein
LEVKRFSDFAKEESPLDGEKIPIIQLLNREIVVTGFKVRASKYGKNKSGKCLTLQVEIDGGRRVLFTGSDILIDQMSKYGDHIPFTTTIKKIDKYYTLS